MLHSGRLQPCNHQARLERPAREKHSSLLSHEENKVLGRLYLVPEGMQLVVGSPERVRDGRAEDRVEVGPGPHRQRQQEQEVEETPDAVGHKPPGQPLAKAETRQGCVYTAEKSGRFGGKLHEIQCHLFGLGIIRRHDTQHDNK